MCRLFCLRPPAQHTYAVTRNQTPSSRRLSSLCPLPSSPWTPPHSSQPLIHTSISLDSSPTLPMLRGGKETQQRGAGALWRSGLAHLPDHQVLTPQGWLPWRPLLSPRMHLALLWVALLNALVILTSVISQKVSGCVLGKGIWPAGNTVLPLNETWQVMKAI